tara:strand:- start:1541 stop:4930 length:3390 start_codon:yes stop_codon:yes gene_type:complete
MLDQDWGAGLVGTVDSSSVVKRFINEPYLILENNEYVPGKDTRYDLEKHFTREIIPSAYIDSRHDESWGYMSAAEKDDHDRALAEFRDKVAAYYNAVSKGDTYDSLGFPLKGTVTAEQEQVAANFKADAIPVARTGPGIPDTTAGVPFTKATPGIVYDPSDPNVFKIGKEKTDYQTVFDVLPTDPSQVTKQETYTHTWPNYWGNMESEQRVKTVVDYDKINRNKKINKDNQELKKKHEALNLRNSKRNNAYANAVKIAKKTERGAYVTNRDQILTEDLDDEVKNILEREFKTFYRNEKLTKWDPNAGTQPDYGSFDADYYGKNEKEVADRYKEFEANDDIDITEGYGRNNYYHWHYTKYGKDEKRRGNAAEKVTEIEKYKDDYELTPEVAVDENGNPLAWAEQTDADLQAIRDIQLGIGTPLRDSDGNIQKDKETGKIKYVHDTTARILRIPEIKALQEEAIRAREEGVGEGEEENRFIQLGKQYFLDIEDDDQFVALFRLSTDPRDSQIKFVNSVENGTTGGITELEDVITGSYGEEGEADVQRFGDLNKLVLRDTIKELKRAKLREQELDIYRNFGSFGEILDVNKTLTDSLLNDTGIGGFLPFLGNKSGLNAQTLEDELQGVTGIRNEMTYNWQKWFDDAIAKKYSDFVEDAKEFGYEQQEAEKKAEEIIVVEKEFAKDYIDNYLRPRFDESRSMNEFIEYLDVRQEEKNPFQTQDLLTAMREAARLKNKAFLSQINENLKLTNSGRFDKDFYFDPTQKGKNEGIKEDSKMRAAYLKQRDTVSSDWDAARANPDQKIEGIDYDTTWKAQAYRYGLDIQKKDQFAHLHFQVKGRFNKDANGKLRPFDGAEDVVNYGTVKNHIYNTVLPQLEDEKLTSDGELVSIFGQFIKPEEFADDMLEGLDPNIPEAWEETLESLGLDEWEGTLEDLRDYIADIMRTGSAAEIRQNIKFLNEKKEKPRQSILGIEYIVREEDYKPADEFKGDTKLYKIFQQAGYSGTETEFYDNVFPDLDPSSQQLLTQAGEGKLTGIPGFTNEDMKDPFAAFAGISNILGEDDDIYGGTDEYLTGKDEKEKKRSSSPFRLFQDTEEEDELDDLSGIFGTSSKSKAGRDLLKEYTNRFSFGNDFI